MGANMTALALGSKVKAASAAGKSTRVGCGAGLSVLVQCQKPKDDGRKSHAGKDKATAAATTWVLRYQVAGRRRDMGLGGYPDVSLAEARGKAAEALAKARAGEDPVDEQQAAKRERKAEVATDRRFRAVAAACIEARKGGWKNAKHASQWTSTLEAHAFPVIGDKPVGRVTMADVEAVLKPIWTEIPETASRLRGRIEAVIDFAVAKGLRPRGPNPAVWKGGLRDLLHAPRKGTAAVRHQPALAWQDMPAFYVELAGKAGMAALVLRLSILTACRSGEARGATWGEFDLDRAVWNIPASRMKAARLHRVPLSPEALALLLAVRPKGKVAGDGLVFPGRSVHPLSDMALSMLLRGMCHDGLDAGEPPRWRDAVGRAIVPHGFRSTFRDWAAETQTGGSHLAELALAHTNKDKVEAAYARSDLLEQRRPLMERWALHVTGAKVIVPLRGGVAA